MSMESLSLSVSLLVSHPAGFLGPKIEATVPTAHPPQASGQVGGHGRDDDGDGDKATPRLATPSPSAPGKHTHASLELSCGLSASLRHASSWIVRIGDFSLLSSR